MCPECNHKAEISQRGTDFGILQEFDFSRPSPRVLLVRRSQLQAKLSLEIAAGFVFRWRSPFATAFDYRQVFVAGSWFNR